MNNDLKYVTLGGGCFWCTEAVFSELKGVCSVKSGYSGGVVVNPTYEQVCTGNTNHAEVVQISYDAAQISCLDILRVFFATHDPTTLNRQGEDIGTQYRSVIYYHDQEQRELAENLIKRLNEEDVYEAEIVTSVEPIGDFFQAEDYHQNYLLNNPSNPFCQAVVILKRDKFRKLFSDLRK
ncbi:MAG: peptide-methionine (S)-S-oxide reductase MsrA [Mangrovibacterium sp.]